MTIRTKEGLISVREAAQECGRNMETVRRWIWGGKLPAEKLGNQLFIKRGDFTSFCRETAIQKYKAEPKADFLERAIALPKREAKLDFLKKATALRNKIHARTGEVFDAEAMIRELRDEREHELE